MVMPYFSSAVITFLAQKVDIKIGHKQASLFSYLRCVIYTLTKEKDKHAATYTVTTVYQLKNLETMENRIYVPVYLFCTVTSSVFVNIKFSWNSKKISFRIPSICQYM